MALFLSVINTISDLSIDCCTEHLSFSSNKCFHRSNSINIDWEISWLSTCCLVDWIFNSQVWSWCKIYSYCIIIYFFNLFEFWNFWPYLYEMIDSFLHWIRFFLLRWWNVYCAWIFIFWKTTKKSTYKEEYNYPKPPLFSYWFFCFYLLLFYILVRCFFF